MASCGDDQRHRVWDLDGDCGGEGRFAEDGSEYYAGTAEMTPLHYRSVAGLTIEKSRGRQEVKKLCKMVKWVSLVKTKSTRGQERELSLAKI